MSRRTFNFKSLLLFFLILSPGGSLLSAEQGSERPNLPQIQDLRQTAQLSQLKNLPILIMFGTDECPFCERLREEFLIPMIISGDYVNKVILREVHIAYQSSLIDFSGNKISTREFSRQYGVKLFPTTIFIDSHGTPLVESIIGITTPSLFGGTLDDQIDKALAVLRKKTDN